MIDNSKLIAPFFKDVDANEFLHCQVVRRAKDHPHEKVVESPVNTYLFKSYNHLCLHKAEIINICETEGARAYINVSPKSFESVNIELLGKLTVAVRTKSLATTSPIKILNSAIGVVKGRPQKWMIDIDDMSLVKVVKRALHTIDMHYGSNTVIYGEIPTVQGEHLIVSPFNRDAFEKLFPEIDIYPNSMGTLLYYPYSLNHGK